MNTQPFEKICVVGLGYIGLPTAAMFASRKIKVVGVDVNQETVDTVNRGDVHIVEPDLDMVVRSVVHEGFLRAATTPEPAEAFLIAVPTPFKGENHEPDLAFIESASRSIARVLAPGNLVILESTSPVGATEKMASWLADARPDLSFPQDAGEDSDIRIAHCPERVLPGKVMRELITNDRVIGGLTPSCSKKAAELYQAFVTADCVIASGPRVAEMAKLTENSFRDVNIAFANELSLICDRLGMDVWELIRLANRHPRVNILQPGPGVGGHCIAVDPWFIVSAAPETARVIKTAREVNVSKSEWVGEQINKRVAQLRRPNPVVAFYGVAFKPDIDDLRESPALQVVKKFNSQHLDCICLIVEPNLSKLPDTLSHANFATVSEAICEADLHVLLVRHKEFVDSTELHGLIAAGGENVLDYCGIGNEPGNR